MRRPVEIEFAATMNREKDKTGTFYLLQIRPIVDSKEMLDEDLTAIPDEKLRFPQSGNSLGDRKIEPAIFGRGQELCTDRTGTLGQQ